MKPKKMFAALSAALLILWTLLPLTGYAEDGKITYICTYYDENGVLVGVKTFQENDLKQILDAGAPSEAVKAKMFQWTEELTPAGDVILSHYARPLDADAENMESTVRAPYVTAEMCTAAYWQNRPGCI